MNVTEEMVVPQILTQMLERTNGSAQPQDVQRPVPVPREVVQKIVREDDHKENTLQTYAETAKKVTIGQRSIYPAERCDDWQDTDPEHDH